MVQNIEKALNEEQEKRISRSNKDISLKETERFLIGKAIESIQMVTSKYSTKDITDTSKFIFRKFSYSKDDCKDFIQDVMKQLEGRKVIKRRGKKDKVDINFLAYKLSNDNQEVS